ncbi:unnamed protein product [Microthlaspi erraticum]|uniref:Uncharacterized protein n=1 Tax=Microthlaspi erraticum TaxID=1685480 RepID=A0A6D2IYN3_9BRAS|nr:unnamed protein product [Microthlaspi erraticum]
MSIVKFYLPSKVHVDALAKRLDEANKCRRSATPTGFVEARSREKQASPKRDPNLFRRRTIPRKASVAEARPQPVSSKHDPEKTGLAKAPSLRETKTKVNGLIIHEEHNYFIISTSTKAIVKSEDLSSLTSIYQIREKQVSPKRDPNQFRRSTTPISVAEARPQSVSSKHDPNNLVEARIREKSSQQSILLDETKESSRQVLTRLYGSKVNNATQHHVSAASRQHRHRVDIA